jgi:hypothetical protein
MYLQFRHHQHVVNMDTSSFVLDIHIGLKDANLHVISSIQSCTKLESHCTNLVSSADFILRGSLDNHKVIKC